jgi:UDP-N-acetylmuramoyl-tripeptide--D-alanyl-D-alanine ligase
LAIWGGLSFFSTTIVSLCFSPLGVMAAQIISCLPFYLFCVLFLIADKKYALKVPVSGTGRLRRIGVVYALFLGVACYLFLWALDSLAMEIGSEIYDLFAYAPFSFITVLLPFLFCAANSVESLYSETRNRKYLKRAGQVLEEYKKNDGLICVGIVGSYGKTSVKYALEKILSVKYEVVATPKSFNTPMGIARTVLSEEFANKKNKIFLAEMGARKRGDIEELCALVKPEWAIFTGVCPQHIESFGSEDEVLKTKCEIVSGAEQVLCGGALKTKMATAGLLGGNCVFLDFSTAIENLQLRADGSDFTLVLGEEKIEVSTKLLGGHNAENIAMAATLAKELGLTNEEIKKGIDGLDYVPHRLELKQENGVYILDDGYNANERGAKEAIAALSRFGGKKIIVTPGIVECGVLEETINGAFGAELAKAEIDKVVLVGTTLVGAVKKGYLSAGGDSEKLVVCDTLEKAKLVFSAELCEGACILFLNDLPDVY